MADEVKRSLRTYHSPLRADQARQTRGRILEAAYRLFVQRGYGGATIAAVAEGAGVSAETVYLAFGGKRGLLEGVIETAIAGEGEREGDDDALWDEVALLPDARKRLERMVEYSCQITARTRPIHMVIRGAADKEPFAAALAKRLLHERLAVQTDRVRRCLGSELRSGLTPAAAGQRYCALTLPELYHVLIVEFDWTADEHRRWLTDVLERELLGAGSPDTGGA
jgi:AcrR family transcriptional regulator